MSVRLSIGLKRESDILKDIELNELDGYAREIINDKSYRSNPSKMTTKLLAHCVDKQMGLTENDFRRMFVVDRNALIMSLQLVSIGDEIPAPYICKWCDQGFEIVENLQELKFSESEQYFETVDVVLEKGYKDKEGDVHKEVTLEIPTGTDEEITNIILHRNYGEWVNTMLARKIKRFGSLDMKKFQGLGVNIIRSLNAKEIDKLIGAITEDLPGFDLKHEVTCPHCGKPKDYILNMTNFF